jgi:hypothetical protein
LGFCDIFNAKLPFLGVLMKILIELELNEAGEVVGARVVRDKPREAMKARKPLALECVVDGSDPAEVATLALIGALNCWGCRVMRYTSGPIGLPFHPGMLTLSTKYIAKQLQNNC